MLDFYDVFLHFPGRFGGFRFLTLQKVTNYQMLHYNLVKSIMSLFHFVPCSLSTGGSSSNNAFLGKITINMFYNPPTDITYILFINMTQTTDDETNRISLLCVCGAIMVVLLIIVLITFREACWITAIKSWEICNIDQENHQNNNNNIIDNNLINNNNDIQDVHERGNPPGNDNNFNQNDLSNANNRHNLSNNYN